MISRNRLTRLEDALNPPDTPAPPQPSLEETARRIAFVFAAAAHGDPRYQESAVRIRTLLHLEQTP